MSEELGELELRRLQYISRGSTVEMRRQNAVCVRHAYKHYGFLKDSFNVLDNLSMTVPRGCIYGLLGASGCGKTTLINCIVGRKRLHSGEIWVLGGAPDTKGSGVPGPEIGFMPQQISLFGEFTTRETMKYFGWITNMKTNEMEERLEFLAALLQLPDIDRQVKVLSGGQQRRVSLAVALLHEPELLILDEPTVGLDPILREIIWNHLLAIARTKHTTVILTTHYIDETKQANLIGLMRGGYIIAEESPRTLLTHCGTETLEEAFLKLSVLQNMSRHRRSSIAQEVTNAISIPPGIINQTGVMDNIDSDSVPEISGEFGDNVSGSYGGRRASILSIKDIPPIPLPEPRKTTPFDYLLNFKMNRINALMWKNYLWFLRNVQILFMILTMPPAITLLFFITIGNDITGLKVALVNHETKNVPCNQAVSCNATQLSCSYLGYLQNRSLDLIPYDSEDEAMQSVLRGETYASIIVRHNYTAALRRRVESSSQADPWSITYSTIDVFRDVSVKDIATIIKLHLYEGLKVFLEDYMLSCGQSAEGLTPPMRFKPPVYGAQRPLYSDFITPALLLTVTFTLAMALTAVALLAERKESILERSLVVGVNPIEVLISHVVINVGIVIGQTILTLAVTFAIYKMTITGSLFLVIILTLLSGICGMCFGFVISCGCDDEIMALSIAAGVFLPTALISGLIWPVEGMHIILQKIAILLPFTKPTESMRSILQRGWGFSEPVVHQGFISLIVWIIIFLIISILCLKFKKG